MWFIKWLDIKQIDNDYTWISCLKVIDIKSINVQGEKV